ncbi:MULTISPECIES: RnfABCDGE type electron transport complex subunit B [unclassified Variovorax]|uniref:RnfABCDGE type electron transport complex subunit B n=1 Tax=unclassified Variovorax TaxID=663243 RepID=UPI00076D80A5|nr:MULTISPECIES: RnfABCDGE type electron transport complex subunit B [unclassified Variovorax]KWT98791.1 Electron transport complex protein RnfB [Variovorax sp. WDL1]PNG56145.1 Electron transport complex subunit RsxB [Variovorax sp. B4]PNG57569.1 Electron transport complex subunit RsxB [Variovorax sp. B2]VTV10027.1 Nitrogen fixation protein rnfB [Variovorax sp. WDL1]
MNALARRILDALPQTQCTRCGYADCTGYAEAIAADEAGIHQCPPGGAEGVLRLSRLTGQPVRPIDPQFGTEGARKMAVIDEAWCIGCTLCLDACPTDAILGIHKRMHTVIETHCTGCELCIPVCPVDCISLEVATPGRSGWQAWSQAQADEARSRYEAHRRRHGKGDEASTVAPPEAAAPDRKRAIIEAALARARAAAASRTDSKARP